jgi:hypothetical protein
MVLIQNLLQVQAVVPHLSFHRAIVYGILKNTNMKVMLRA